MYLVTHDLFNYSYEHTYEIHKNRGNFLQKHYTTPVPVFITTAITMTPFTILLILYNIIDSHIHGCAPFAESAFCNLI